MSTDGHCCMSVPARSPLRVHCSGAGGAQEERPLLLTPAPTCRNGIRTAEIAVKTGPLQSTTWPDYTDGRAGALADDADRCDQQKCSRDSCKMMDARMESRAFACTQPLTLHVKHATHLCANAFVKAADRK